METTHGEIIDLTSYYILKHDNDKYSKYLNIKYKNSNSK